MELYCSYILTTVNQVSKSNILYRQVESEARDCSSCRDSQVRSSLLFTEKLLSDHFQFFDFLLRQYKLFLIDIFASGKLLCKRRQKIYNHTTLRLLSS